MSFITSAAVQSELAVLKELKASSFGTFILSQDPDLSEISGASWCFDALSDEATNTKETLFVSKCDVLDDNTLVLNGCGNQELVLTRPQDQAQTQTQAQSLSANEIAAQDRVTGASFPGQQIVIDALSSRKHALDFVLVITQDPVNSEISGASWGFDSKADIAEMRNAGFSFTVVALASAYAVDLKTCMGSDWDTSANYKVSYKFAESSALDLCLAESVPGIKAIVPVAPVVPAVPVVPVVPVATVAQVQNQELLEMYRQIQSSLQRTAACATQTAVNDAEDDLDLGLVDIESLPDVDPQTDLAAALAAITSARPQLPVRNGFHAISLLVANNGEGIDFSDEAEHEDKASQNAEIPYSYPQCIDAGRYLRKFDPCMGDSLLDKQESTEAFTPVSSADQSFSHLPDSKFLSGSSLAKLKALSDLSAAAGVATDPTTAVSNTVPEVPAISSTEDASPLPLMPASSVEQVAAPDLLTDIADTSGVYVQPTTSTTDSSVAVLNIAPVAPATLITVATTLPAMPAPQDAPAHVAQIGSVPNVAATAPATSGVEALAQSAQEMPSPKTAQAQSNEAVTAPTAAVSNTVPEVPVTSSTVATTTPLVALTIPVGQDQAPVPPTAMPIPQVAPAHAALMGSVPNVAATASATSAVDACGQGAKAQSNEAVTAPTAAVSNTVPEVIATASTVATTTPPVVPVIPVGQAQAPVSPTALPVPQVAPAIQATPNVAATPPTAAMSNAAPELLATASTVATTTPPAVPVSSVGQLQAPVPPTAIPVPQVASANTAPMGSMPNVVATAPATQAAPNVAATAPTAAMSNTAQVAPVIPVGQNQTSVPSTALPVPQVAPANAAPMGSMPNVAVPAPATSGVGAMASTIPTTGAALVSGSTTAPPSIQSAASVGSNTPTTVPAVQASAPVPATAAAVAQAPALAPALAPATVVSAPQANTAQTSAAIVAASADDIYRGHERVNYGSLIDLTRSSSASSPKKTEVSGVDAIKKSIASADAEPAESISTSILPRFITDAVDKLCVQKEKKERAKVSNGRYSKQGKVELDELRKILNYLDYCDREQWYKTFAILGREYGADMDVLHVAQEWSRKYPHRKPKDELQEQREFFQSSKRSGPGIGALIAEAKRHGYEVPRHYKKFSGDDGSSSGYDPNDLSLIRPDLQAKAKAKAKAQAQAQAQTMGQGQGQAQSSASASASSAAASDTASTFASAAADAKVMGDAQGLGPDQSAAEFDSEVIYSNKVVFVEQLEPLAADCPVDSDESKLYDSVQSKANAILKFWLYTAGNGNVPDRVNFLTENKKFFGFFPVEQRVIIEALYEFCKSHEDYSISEFLQWCKLEGLYDVFDQGVLNTVLDTETIQSKDMARDYMRYLYEDSYTLMLWQRACLFAAGVLKRSFKANTSAVRYFFEESLPVMEGETAPVEQWPADVRAEVIERIDEKPNMERFVPSGYAHIDEHIMGFRRGEVTIFAAHSGVGKTWFALDTTVRLLNTFPNARVLFISSEMSVREIELRFYGLLNDISLLKHDLQRLAKDGNKLLDSFKKLDSFAESRYDITLYGNKSGGTSIDDIEALVSGLSASKRLDLVVVDYIQNIVNETLPNKNNNTSTFDRVRNTMNRLDRLANTYNCAVLSLAQLNNPNRKQGQNLPPNLYDIAECTYMVQPAAAVLMMYKGDLSAGLVSINKSKDKNANAGGSGGSGSAGGSGGSGSSSSSGSDVGKVQGSLLDDEEDRVFNQTDLLLAVRKSRYGTNSDDPLHVFRSEGARFLFEP